MWSFGVVVWEVFTAGALPYSQWTNAEVIIKVPHRDPRADVQVAEGARLLCPPNTPQELAELMASCWQADPSTRPTARAAVKGAMDALLHSRLGESDSEA